MHSVPIQLRFNDIDQMGHVNNAVIMEFFDLGKSAYFTSLGINPEDGDFTVIVVHLDVDFQSQIHYRDQVSVETCVCKIGNKSLHLLQRVVKPDGTVCAICRTVMSGYLRSAKCSAAIPEAYKSLIPVEGE